MPLSPKQIAEIVQTAAANASDMSNAEIGNRFGVSHERIRQILKAHGKHKPRKLGTQHSCKKPGCPRKFRGTSRYSGHKARFCPRHRK